MISYRYPPNVKEDRIDNHPVLTTEQDGKIAVDAEVLSLWEFANDKTLEAILA